MFVIGSALMPLYLLITVFLSISVLSSKIYCSLDTPIITMWQSCYVASFIDRFETVVICALFVVCVAKAGILLKCVFDIFSAYRPLAFVVFSLSVIPLVLMPSLVYLYAVLVLACSIIYVINILLIKCY